jgi:hypothetical protein
MKKIYLFFLVFNLAILNAYAENLNEIKIYSASEDIIPLLDEDLEGITSRPLIKLKEKMDKKHYKGFLELFKIKVIKGSVLKAEYKLEKGPYRLTVYEISKEKKSLRKLQVVASGYYEKGEIAKFQTKARDIEEQLFFVTAEQVSSKEELNQHLRYMNGQDNQLILKGYSTNFTLSELKFKLCGKDSASKEDNFKKDAEWLIDKLIKPVFLVAIRIETS